MQRTKVLFIFISILTILVCFDSYAQFDKADSLTDISRGMSLHKRISVSVSAGKRTNDLSLKPGLQFLTYANWKKIDFGVGVNYEDEDFFNLIPAYVHIAYNPIPDENHAKIFIQSGLAFNVPASIEYDYGKPGFMCSGGIEQEFVLFKKLSSVFQISYRFQQTSTVREWTSSQAGQDYINSEVIKHSMHRILVVYGINF
ncbi:hypothetical protein MATR_21610 [Marivirga tractuosa]|uniref:Uncharacterized protein n=1 Tax=Marivirga tractuosa (strain ATCC 23168 / DSM 4126 / NBRC 15989 / NCIMB 1408 / VKM B-1430 / H-43) TaxID=643867 RepID=E4TL85_MARTH|nr:hypothetical protein [Marivirga tractuosa]ADR20223.1 hypothetical protein Ftrac_0212 [Marivirga tractuosa DSM 4126]BDD15336.1 hypothetical protein MATR_21610 [Marivirga tractuosa]